MGSLGRKPQFPAECYTGDSGGQSDTAVTFPRSNVGDTIRVRK